MNVSSHAGTEDIRTTAAVAEYDIVLKPVDQPQIGDIRINENLFAVGRGEPPFDVFPTDLTADLSRRHARIFSEYGDVYIADLGSKNGTTVNGAKIAQKIVRLQDGDEICFAGRLTFRVQLRQRAYELPRSERLIGVTLTPEVPESGLQPIVIAQFPFLISKTDDAFARYKRAQPHQVNYLSRRHAHLFTKGGEAFIEDLGSTNGTFVCGKRLDERAVRLQDGDVLAFGGNHFVYRVALDKEEVAADTTVTKMSAARIAASAAHMADKTTFVESANSFLDIFCVDRAQAQDDEVNRDAVAQESAAPAQQGTPRGKLATFLHEFTNAFALGESLDHARLRRRAVLAAAFVAVAGTTMALYGAPERNIRRLLDEGRYAQAAQAAGRHLASNPDDVELKGLATEAALKASVPAWWAAVKARRFDAAGAQLAPLRALAGQHTDLQPIVAELEWIAALEQHVAARGGADADIRSAADEQAIKRLVGQWEGEAQRHQRAYALISAHVPEFKDYYAQTLSHLRRLALAGSRQGGNNHGQREAAAPSDGSVGGP